MELRHPEYLAAIVAFALLLFLLAKTRRDGYYFSSRLATKKIGFLWQLLAITPNFLYLGTVLALLIAIAAPFTQKVRNETVIEGKIIQACIDVSGSMDNYASPTQTKLEFIQKILNEFMESRSEVDAVGISAFSGGGNEWGAAIIQRPTISKETFMASARVIKSQMFGNSTAIGEGIFVSILAVSEIEWHKKIQEESGNQDEEFNIQRLWAAVNTLDLPEYGLPNPDAKTKDDFIISEAVRLTPPENNKNKIIILFSDGDSNEGLDPIKAIWLAERLGIKVYYVEVLTMVQDETDSNVLANAYPIKKTGGMFRVVQQADLAQEDYGQIPPHRQNLILAVNRTGGKYYSGHNYNDVRNFFMEISRLEKGRVVIVEKYDTQESYIFWVWIACYLFAARFFLKIITNL